MLIDPAGAAEREFSATAAGVENPERSVADR